MRRFAVPELVMGFHPTARGFGWVVFAGPAELFDWGLTYNRGGDKNAACLKQMRLLLERHRPETLVMEGFDRRTGKRASRVGQLCLAVTALADELGVEVSLYWRRDIRKALQLPPTATRQEVADTVARHCWAISHRLPKQRRPWDSVDRRMALFNAAALALTHYCDGTDGVFDRRNGRN
jgi:Holliday junction resolvasome RuvABC endonuclease subunit